MKPEIVRARCRSHWGECFTGMTVQSEGRIQQLCTEALASQTQADVDRIIPELRAALEEHIRFSERILDGAGEHDCPSRRLSQQSVV
jgi:hypothetical protein